MGKITLKELEQQRDLILQLARQHGAYNVRVFGSVARGTALPDSDIDVLVEFEPQRSLLDQATLTQELEALLGCAIHVVEPDGLHWYIRSRVLAEAVPL